MKKHEVKMAIAVVSVVFSISSFFVVALVDVKLGIALAIFSFLLSVLSIWLTA